MTTRDDLHDVETRLRTALRERADDVETTPVLYERVQRQAALGTWLRRGLLLAGAAAAVLATVTVVPTLLPDATPIDIADDPEDAQPTEAPSAEPGDVDIVDPLVEEHGLAYARSLDVGGSSLHVGDRVVLTDVPVVALAGNRSWTPQDGVVAAGLADGSIVLVDQEGGGGSDVDGRVPAAANGGGVGFSPDGEAIAWIEGSDLHILPLGSEPDGERVQPLVGDVPEGLVLEQWFEAADASVILASDPGGGIWSIPMDVSNVFNTGPTDTAFLLEAEAVDAALLDDLRRVELRRAEDGFALVVDGTVRTADLPDGDTLELTTDGRRVVVFDPAGGTGVMFTDVAGVELLPDVSWEGLPATAVTQLAPPVVTVGDEPPDTPQQEPDGSDAAELGLRTDAPVVGTDGVELVIRYDDGTVERREVYPAGESEAVLGRVAVRPGSTPDDGLVAVESSSEGETSIRLVALRDGGTSLVGDVIVTSGPLTGLVWSEDGTRIAWTDAAGLHESPLSDSGGLGGELLVEDTGPVVDWVWTQDDGVEATGHLTILVNGGTGVELLGIDRAADGTVTMTGPAGGGDRVLLDTHAVPGAGVGPTVTADVGGGTAQLTWFADGDQDGTLPDPGVVGGDVRVGASGGHVLVLGMDRQVLVTFAGDVVELPPAADWDVLD